MTATTGTPEAVPTPRPELSDSERAVMSLGAADEWRAAQSAELDNLRDNGDVFDREYITTFHDGIDDNIDAYLQAKGIEPTSPHYDEMRKALRDVSIDRVSDEEWYTRPSSRGETVDPEDDHSARDLFARRMDEYVAAHTVATPEQNAEDTQARTERLTELEGELNEARDRFSTLAANRQSSAVRGETKEYKEAQDAYRTAMREYGKLSLKDTIDDEDVSDEDKNTAVIGYILDQETKLRDATNEKRDNKPINKFIKWMNKGKLPMRVAKGVALGLVAGVTGALIAGATGGVVVASLAAAASRFVRGYVMHADKRTMEALNQADVKQAVQEDLTNSTDTDRDAFAATDEHLRGLFEKDTKIQQNERRKALAWGIGSVAVGGALGMTLTYALDHGQSVIGGFGENHGGAQGHGGGLDHNGGQNQAPSPDSGYRGGSSPNASDYAGHTPGHEATPVHHLLDREAAFTITPGEGLYETFQEMGIPSADWHDVMIDAGPKLHDLGEAYWDPSHAEWRISHPGRWSDAAMKAMTDAATRHGYSLAA